MRPSHGELLSSPRQLLVLLPYDLRAFFFPLVLPLLLPCCPVLPQLLSALAQSHFSLPEQCSLPFCCPSHFDFEWGLVYILAQTAERKDGPGVRVTAWAGGSHIQLSVPPTSHLTLGILFHTPSCPPLPSSKHCPEISLKCCKHSELDVNHQPLQKNPANFGWMFIPR